MSDSEEEDHYKVIDVPISADAQTIRKAYRKLALKWHPDKNPGNAVAAQKFRKIFVSYSILSDTEKRKGYDEKVKRKLEKRKKEEAKSEKQRSMKRDLEKRERDALKRRMATQENEMESKIADLLAAEIERLRQEGFGKEEEPAVPADAPRVVKVKWSKKLSDGVSEDGLYQTLDRFGKIRGITMRPEKGIALVEYASSVSAARAMHHTGILHVGAYGGIEVRVQPLKSKGKAADQDEGKSHANPSTCQPPPGPDASPPCPSSYYSNLYGGEKGASFPSGSSTFASAASGEPPSKRQNVFGVFGGVSGLSTAQKKSGVFGAASSFTPMAAESSEASGLSHEEYEDATLRRMREMADLQRRQKERERLIQEMQK